MALRQVLMVVTVGIFLVACGDRPATPTVPVPPPTASPSPSALTTNESWWSGSFATSNWGGAMKIAVLLKEEDGVLSGQWIDVSYMDFGGTVSAIVDRSSDPWSLKGLITLVGTSFPACEAAFSGTGGASLQEWSIPGFTGECALYGLPKPLDVQIFLQRDRP